MIKLVIDVTKIPRDKIFQGKKRKYVTLVFFENKDGQDEYGNDGFLSIDVSKEEREAGKRGAIVGNGKYLGRKPAQTTMNERSAASPAGKPQQSAPDVEEDDVPF